MEDNSELTNIPDYQKIRQTNQTSGVQGPGTDWNEGIETLTPSPVLRQPNSSSDSPRQMQSSQRQAFDNYTWEGNQGANRSNSGISASVSKASWEAQPQYNASKYGLVYNPTISVPEAKTSFIPQGYTRPVTKYVDANGVERRVLARSSAGSVNRHSFTENYFTGSNADLSSLNRGDVGLKSTTGLKSHNKSGTWGVGGSLENLAEHSSKPFTQASLYGSSLALPLHGKYRQDWKEVNGNPVSSKNPQDDLRHWQQLHQEELLHQHLETQALYESPSSQGQTLVDPLINKLSLQDEAPARWEPVRRAADNIIREKNMIIDKLKNRILELEEDFKVSENKMRQTIMTNQGDVEIIQQKLQEVQHKNATFKERMNEERTKKNQEIDDLELKLGASEHEVQQLKDALRRKDIEISNIKAQTNDVSLEADAWKEKFNESRTTHQEMKKKLDSLQTYLNDLPTVEESRLKTEQILSLSDENEGLKMRVESADKKLSQVRKVVTARDFRIRELEEREKALESKIAQLTDKVDQLQDSEGSELYKTQQDLAMMGSEKERLTVDLEKAKKLLEATHFKLRQVEVKYQGDLTAIQERLTQEEENVEYLRTEIVDKEAQIKKMKKSIKDLGTQNQDLLQEGLMVREQARHMEAGNANVSFAMQSTFMSQLSLCFSELHALVEVCTKRAHGEDPDLSLLLGVKDPKYSEDGDQDGARGSQADHTQTMAQWTTSLGELRRDIDKLRAHVCNRYAEDMGDNINCATQ